MAQRLDPCNRCAFYPVAWSFFANCARVVGDLDRQPVAKLAELLRAYRVWCREGSSSMDKHNEALSMVMI